MESKKFLLASASAVKVKALQDFVGGFFSKQYEIEPVDVSECKLPEQPIGRNCGYFFAKERVNFLKSRYGRDFAKYDYVVAIENGIQDDADVCFVIVIHKDILSCGESWPVRPDVEFLHFLKQQDPMVYNKNIVGYEKTLGEIIRDMDFLLKDSSESSARSVDPHNVHMSQGTDPSKSSARSVDPKNWHVLYGRSREEQIEDALTKAFWTVEHELPRVKAIQQHHSVYEDYPKPGVSFVDFMPLFANASAFGNLTAHIKKQYQFDDIDFIVGLESRGFILGAAVARGMGVGFVPVRKVTKEKKCPLPGETYNAKFEKEYGFDEFQIQANAFPSDSRVLIIDDLIATGGSIQAACDLVRRLDAIIVDVCVLQAIPGILAPTFNIPVTALFQ